MSKLVAEIVLIIATYYIKQERFCEVRTIDFINVIQAFNTTN